MIKEGASINYANFIQIIINFLFIAAAILVIVKGINSLKRKEDAAPATSTLSKEEIWITEIQNLLRAGANLQFSAFKKQLLVNLFLFLLN